MGQTSDNFLDTTINGKTSIQYKINDYFPKYKRESFFGVAVKYSVPIARKYKAFISQQTDKESFAKMYQCDF